MSKNNKIAQIAGGIGIALSSAGNVMANTNGVTSYEAALQEGGDQHSALTETLIDVNCNDNLFCEGLTKDGYFVGSVRDGDMAYEVSKGGLKGLPVQVGGGVVQLGDKSIDTVRLAKEEIAAMITCSQDVNSSGEATDIPEFAFTGGSVDLILLKTQGEWKTFEGTLENGSPYIRGNTENIGDFEGCTKRFPDLNVTVGSSNQTIPIPEGAEDVEYSVSNFNTDGGLNAYMVNDGLRLNPTRFYNDGLDVVVDYILDGVDKKIMIHLNLVAPYSAPAPVAAPVVATPPPPPPPPPIDRT